MSGAVTKPEDTKQAKRTGRFVTRREAIEAASRLRTAADGSRYVIRFSFDQRIEHLVLTVSFTMLGITGLAQTFYDTLMGSFILTLFGGIDGTRQVHHVFAFIFGAQSIYHVGLFVYNLVMYRKISKIWPEWSDLTHFFQMMKLNLGLSKEHPRFDRYTFEEKAEYWALVWGTAVMGVTGLMQWFPVFVTELMPGWAIPAGRALHKWEAILAVLAILTWHFYHAVLKQFNKSIFTGTMTIDEMEEEHPAELSYLERLAAIAGNTKWPVFVDLSPEAAESKAEAKPATKSEDKPKKKSRSVKKTEPSEGPQE